MCDVLRSGCPLWHVVAAPCTSNCAAARRRTLPPSFYRGRVNALVRFVVVDAVRRSRACVVRVSFASVCLLRRNATFACSAFVGILDTPERE